ncbi:MAG: hypothetical protein JWQ54_2193 [Mucilaginibacter sp.]|nr:hypothetical protein [Mucilaginibacter sp.]
MMWVFFVCRRLNEIVESFKGWPNEQTIMVFLKSPFIGYYKFNDMIIGTSMISTIGKLSILTNHVLACKLDLTKPPGRA